MNLFDLKILALDCQTTGANPGKGKLLEIGWATGRAGSDGEQLSSARSFLLRPAFEMPIPPAVRRITGISSESAAHALPENAVWRKLLEAADSTAAENGFPVCPTVIHFARFEAPFLHELHRANESETPFPLGMICTHAIASRLLPDLPRRSIRALAGYFGHPMPELKRSADHARATAAIWKALIELLQARFDIGTLPQLTAWLEETRPPRRSKRSFPIDPGIPRAVPEKPGIYRMRRADGGILYIGKAKSLKSRVRSYFQNGAHPEHILEMLTQTRDLDFLTAETALEAAVLESDEIKRHEPPYNVALRSGNRCLVFCTRDLKAHSAVCDPRFCLGPLPDGKEIESLHAFEGWLSNGMRIDSDCIRGIGFPQSAQEPSRRCIEEGFDLFRVRHLDRLKNRPALRAVTALGAHLWRENLAAEAECSSNGEREAEDRSFDAEEAIPSPEEARFTPAGIAAALEGLLLRSAHRMRRARWFCLLSESTVAWAPAADPDRLKHAIVLERGTIVARDDFHSVRNPPVPPGFRRPLPARKQNLDLQTYDRMRVLTTELRRLLCQGRKIEIHLGPKVKLTSLELKKALRWV